MLYAGTLIESGNTKDDKEEENDEEEETHIDIEALICDQNDTFLPVTADFACTTKPSMQPKNNATQNHSQQNKTSFCCLSGPLNFQYS